MRYIKWYVLAFVAVVVFGFAHYTLPQHDIVRITGTEVIRQDFTGWNRIFYAQPDSGNTDGQNRDLRLINAVYPNGNVMVFRNEDTGWGWPPYFKFDTSNVQAQADDLKSSKDTPRWAVVTHYGWRIIYLSAYPNAMSIREVDSKDVTIIPWFNIIFLTLVALITLRIYRWIQKFRERNIDPVLEDVSEAWDNVEDRADAMGDRASGLWGRFTAWIGTWRSKK